MRCDSKLALRVIIIGILSATGLHAQGTPACQASVFVTQSLEKRPSIPSPDGKYRVVLSIRSEDDDHGSLHVYQGRKRIARFLLRDLSGGIFVKWAPDSQAFYFMWSNGGMLGGYSVRVFRISGEEILEPPTTKEAEADFAGKHHCETRDNNTLAIKWIGDSNHLLVASQVYPTSDCGKEAGLVGGYLVRTDDGAILRRYSEKQINTIWPKGCPSAVYPTAFWDASRVESAVRELQLKNRKQ